MICHGVIIPYTIYNISHIQMSIKNGQQIPFMMENSFLYNERYRGNRDGYGVMSEEHLWNWSQYEQQHGLEVDEVNERSAGCVVFSHDPDTNHLLVMLIKNRKHVYGFPKGHLEQGEDDITAAIRETVEETGVTLTPESVFDSIHHRFELKMTLFNKLHKSMWVNHPKYPNERERPHVIKYKTVVYVPAYTKNLVCTPQLEEVLDASFYKVDEAFNLLNSTLKGILEDLLQCKILQEWLITNK